MNGSRAKVRLSADIVDLVRSLHPHLTRKIRAAFRAILDNPLSGKALKDELEGLRSFRVGRIRIIYSTRGKETVEVIAVGPRKTIYEETLRLLKKET